MACRVSQVDAQVLAAAGRAPCLRALSLAFCKGVGDEALSAFAAAASAAAQDAAGAATSRGSGTRGSSRERGLQELVLDECAGVTDAGLLALHASADGGKHLRRLSLAHCVRVTDAGLAPLAERGALQALCLNSLCGVGARSLLALSRCCGESLRELDVSFCRGITEGALGALVDRCVRLRVLSVYSCTQLTRRFLFGHSREGLQVLGVPTSCA
jgi:DNA repair protein RAD7